jgi:hypothetical protein
VAESHGVELRIFNESVVDLRAKLGHSEAVVLLTSSKMSHTARKAAPGRGTINRIFRCSSRTIVASAALPSVPRGALADDFARQGGAKPIVMLAHPFLVSAEGYRQPEGHLVGASLTFGPCILKAGLPWSFWDFQLRHRGSLGPEILSPGSISGAR